MVDARIGIFPDAPASRWSAGPSGRSVSASSTLGSGPPPLSSGSTGEVPIV